MTPVVVRARAELRARLASVLALALLVGLGTGAVMTTMAGARRTDSAYRRFAASHKAADMMIYPPFGPEFANLDFDTVARLPQVVASARFRLFATAESTFGVGAGDASYGTQINVPKVISGRLPNPQSTNEAAVVFTLAKRMHLHVGSTLPITFLDQKDQPITVAVHVVGIEASPGEFPPQLSPYGPTDNIHISQGLAESMSPRVTTFPTLVLRFRHGGADVTSVVAELNKLAHDKPQLNLVLGDQAANVQRSIHLQAVALRIVGALVGLIGLLVLSQLLSRQAALDAVENPTLSALGMSRVQIWIVGMSRVAVVGIAGSAIGVLIAVAASSLMPIGTARVAEPHLGVSFDALVFGLGIVATIAGVIVLAAWPVWKAARSAKRYTATADSSTQPSLVARTAARPGFPPSVTAGIRLALEPGRGATEVPVRSSLLSVILAIAALTSALTFGSSLNHLLASPRLYGWNWDAHIINDTDHPNMPPVLKLMQDSSDVEDAILVDTPPLAIGDQRFDGLVFEPVKGSIDPVIAAGRAPRRADEIVVGARTLHDAHASIGSTVAVQIAAVEGNGKQMRVVGTAVIPPQSDSARLGVGAVMTIAGERAMIPPGIRPPPVTDLYIRLAPGMNKKQALARLGASLPHDFHVLLPQRPTDLVNFGQVQNLPLVLAGLVALLAAATLAHTLVTAIRRRRRDLAILKMLGFVPSQVRWTVAWQATTFVSAALLIGLPVGVGAGRVIWTAFANQLGALAEPVTPSLALLVTIPGAILLANLIASAPALIAGRMKPAVVLRAE